MWYIDDVIECCFPEFSRVPAQSVIIALSQYVGDGCKLMIAKFMGFNACIKDHKKYRLYVGYSTRCPTYLLPAIPYQYLRALQSLDSAGSNSLIPSCFSIKTVIETKVNGPTNTQNKGGCNMPRGG